jgi:hypothetical protein
MMAWRIIPDVRVRPRKAPRPHQAFWAAPAPQPQPCKLTHLPGPELAHLRARYRAALAQDRSLRARKAAVTFFKPLVKAANVRASEATILRHLVYPVVPLKKQARKRKAARRKTPKQRRKIQS